MRAYYAITCVGVYKNHVSSEEKCHCKCNLLGDDGFRHISVNLSKIQSYTEKNHSLWLHFLECPSIFLCLALQRLFALIPNAQFKASSHAFIRFNTADEQKRELSSLSIRLGFQQLMRRGHTQREQRMQHHTTVGNAALSSSNSISLFPSQLISSSLPLLLELSASLLFCSSGAHSLLNYERRDQTHANCTRRNGDDARRKHTQTHTLLLRGGREQEVGEFCPWEIRRRERRRRREGGIERDTQTTRHVVLHHRVFV